MSVKTKPKKSSLAKCAMTIYVETDLFEEIKREAKVSQITESHDLIQAYSLASEANL